MNRVFTWLGVGLAGLVLPAGALFANVGYFKPLRIEWFYGGAFAKFAIDRPELLSSLRILPRWLDFYGADLDDVSPAAKQKAADKVRDAHLMLSRHDRSALDYLARLAEFPRKFDQLIENLKLREAKGVIPPQFTVEKVLAQVEEAINAVIRWMELNAAGRRSIFRPRRRPGSPSHSSCCRPRMR